LHGITRVLRIVSNAIFPHFPQASVGKDGEKPVAEAATVHRIRITLTGRNVRSLEKVCADLISGAKKQKLRVKVSVKFKVFMYHIYSCIYLGDLRAIHISFVLVM
jgi:hypothetical protein